jgi:glycosyltransferase involved in cell wall biosynthesis
MKSTEKPLVTVVTPSYNQAKFIEETLLSVRGQDCLQIEHIVIDGGSTDSTLDVLRRYQSTYALRWLSEPDAGQSDAINKGFLLASGEIIGWLNSDDTYLPGTVARAVACLRDHPDVGWVYGDGYWIDVQGRVLSKCQSAPYDFKGMVYPGIFIVQPTVFFRREVLDRVGLVDVDMHLGMDYDFFLRLGHECKGRYIPNVLATRRLHPAAKSLGRSTEFGNDAISALDKLYARSDLPREVLQVKHSAYAKQHLIAGYRAFNAGQFGKARQLLWESWKRDSRLWRKETIIVPLLLLETWMGLRWVAPGRSRRIAEKEFQAHHGPMSVCWREDEIELV